MGVEKIENLAPLRSFEKDPGETFDFIQSALEDPFAVFLGLLEFLPVSLAVRELVRMKALGEVKTLTPVLDVGCGDGLFWQVLIEHLQKSRQSPLKGLFGIDIDKNELALASARIDKHGAKTGLVDITTIDNSEMASPEQAKFQTVIANCSLEHVRNLPNSLKNISQVLEPGGKFLLFLPAPHWTDTLMVKRFLHKIHFRIGQTYGACFDGFFQHFHLYPDYVWRALLEDQGFEVISIRGLGSRASNQLFEKYLPTALVGFLFKSLIKHYPRSFGLFKASIIRNEIRSLIAEVNDGNVLQSDLQHPEVSEYFIEARVSK